MIRAVRGREVKAVAWRRWKVRVHYWGSGGGGAHFIKAGESVGVTWGLVGWGGGEGVWYRVFSGEGGELSRTLRLEQTTPLKWLGRLRSVDVGPLTFKDTDTQTDNTALRYGWQSWHKRKSSEVHCGKTHRTGTSSPGGGGGGLVGVPVLGGSAGGTSDWVSSLNTFLFVLESNGSLPLDWKARGNLSAATHI